MDETFVDRDPASQVLAPPANPKYKPPLRSGPSITFPLPDNNQIEIRLAKPVSKKVFEKIKQLVDLSEDSLVLADNEQTNE